MRLICRSQDSSSPLRNPLRLLATFGFVLLLSACATYQAQPLEDLQPLAGSLQELQSESEIVHDGAPVKYAIDLSKPISLTDIGMLAVMNNPDLKSLRSQWQLAAAQTFATSLWPDPTLAASMDNPMGNTAGLVNPWLVDLGYDIVPLITRRARVDAAQQGQKQVYLDLLWQEWQVIQQARVLAVRLQFEEQQLNLLLDMRGLYQNRYQRSAKAMQEGNITLDITGTDLTALVSALSQINQLQQTINETRHALNLLLGLASNVDINLAGQAPPPDLDTTNFGGALNRLAEVRPDLLALKAGYASQEANVRAAILAQFPSISVGINRARDSGNLNSVGFGISLTLPVFSGNRGNIAIERATRTFLRDEYAARLASTKADVDRLLALQDILQQQQANFETYLPSLGNMVDLSRKAYDKGDIDAITFLNMESTWVNQRLEQINLVQLMWENRIALETMLGLPNLPSQPISLPQDQSETKR